MNLIPSGLPLEPGDHLIREEFEQRYEAMPNLKAKVLQVVQQDTTNPEHIAFAAKLRQSRKP